MTDKSEKNFQVGYETFETLEEATTKAQIEAERNRKDKKIWKLYGVVKYPVPTYPVELTA